MKEKAKEKEKEKAKGKEKEKKEKEKEDEKKKGKEKQAKDLQAAPQPQVVSARTAAAHEIGGEAVPRRRATWPQWHQEHVEPNMELGRKSICTSLRTV